MPTTTRSTAPPGLAKLDAEIRRVAAEITCPTCHHPHLLGTDAPCHCGCPAPPATFRSEPHAHYCRCGSTVGHGGDPCALPLRIERCPDCCVPEPQR